MTTFRDYKRGRILDALMARLREIRAEYSYATDAGANVALGRVSTSRSDAYPRLALVPGETATLITNGRDILRTLPLTVEGVIDVDPADPIRPVEALLGDVKRAIFSPEDQTLGGLLVEDDGLSYGEERHLEAEPGASLVGCQVDLVVKYWERYGHPEILA
jgi:hypothetical protein